MQYRGITSENFYLTEIRNTCRFILENGIQENLKELLKKNNILESAFELEEKKVQNFYMKN